MCGDGTSLVFLLLPDLHLTTALFVVAVVAVAVAAVVLCFRYCGLVVDDSSVQCSHYFGLDLDLDLVLIADCCVVNGVVVQNVFSLLKIPSEPSLEGEIPMSWPY